MEVAALMNQNVVTVAVAASVNDAAAAMDAAGIGAVLVTDGDRVRGVFTERDVIRALAGGADPAARPASEFMTSDVVTIAPAAGLDEAARLMAGARVRHLPVVDDSDHLVGLLSMRRLIRWSVREMAADDVGEIVHFELSQRVLSLVHDIGA